MPIISQTIVATHKIHGTPVVPPPGLSAGTQLLWLAARRYRQRADELAADTRQVSA